MATKKSSSKKKTVKKKPVSTLKPSDYSIQEGTRKMWFARPVQVNDEHSELRVELSINYKKNAIIAVNGKINNNQITGDAMKDDSLLTIMNELKKEAIAKGLQLQREYRELNDSEDHDPNQIDMGL